MAKILFVEFPEHAEEAKALSPGCEIIALTPHAAIELDALGVTYRFPEDIFPWRDLETAGIEFLDELKAVIKHIDARMWDAVPEFKDAGFTPARFATYELLNITASVWTKVYRVMRTLRALQPSHVTYFSVDALPQPDPLDFSGCSLYAPALALVCESFGIATTAAEKSMPEPCRWTGQGSDPPLPQRRRSPLDRVREILAAYRDSRSEHHGKPRVLVIQTPLPFELLRRNVEVIHWPLESESPATRGGTGVHACAGQVSVAWDCLKGENEFRSLFRLDGCDWFALVADRLWRFIGEEFPRAFGLFERATAFIDQTQPHALLYSNFYQLDLHAVAHAARRKALPVICEPHGPYGHFEKWISPATADSISATDYLVGGPGAQRHDREHGVPSMREHCIGATMMDRLDDRAIDRGTGLRALGLEPDKPTVIFAIQNVQGNREYGPYVQRDDRRTWRIEKRILDVLARHEGIQVILKGHPATEYPVPPLKAYGEMILGPRFRFVASWPFSGMLELGDMFLLGYAVTTIYQALTRTKRIYTPNDFYLVVPFHRHLLENAVYYAEDIDAFCAMLDRDLASGDAFRPSEKDHLSFLRELADPGGKSTPTMRAVETIRDIAAESMRRQSARSRADGSATARNPAGKLPVT